MTPRDPKDEPADARLQTVQQRSEEVKELIEELLRHPSPDTLMLLEEDERFQRCDFVAALTFLARTLGGTIPPECLRGPVYRASARLVILDELDPEGFDASLAVPRAGAWCVLGLGCHLGGDVEVAEATYAEAARLYSGMGERIERGTFSFLLGKLRLETGRYDEALALFGRAVAVFEETAGDAAEAEVQEAWLSSLLSMGRIHLEEGSPYRALPVLTLARQRSRAPGDPAACAEADFCLAWCYAELGQRHQAEALASAAEGFAGRVSRDRWTDLRWLQGRVEARLGRLKKAVRELRYACEELRSARNLRDAALATLDLSAELVRQKRGAEARVALGELTAAFLDDPRLDAVITSLTDFVQSVEDGSPWEEAMRRALFRLRRLSQRAPSLPADAPSNRFLQ